MLLVLALNAYFGGQIEEAQEKVEKVELESQELKEQERGEPMCMFENNVQCHVEADFDEEDSSRGLVCTGNPRH